MDIQRRTPQGRCMRRKASQSKARAGGAVAIMALAAMLIIYAFCGLALDLSRVYNRKMEMQSAADGAALGAAIELDGSKAGIGRSAQKVNSLFAIPLILGGPSYGYRQRALVWSDSAIEFARSPDGPWLSREMAVGRGDGNGLFFTRVNTAKFDEPYGDLSTWFMPIVSSTMTTVSTSAQAVAGPTGIAVAPLGLCIMHPDARRARGTLAELEEYGFRRGVSYDLMQLNPKAETATSFLIHPLSAPGASGVSASDFATVAPFVCTGTMAMTRVTGGDITVSSPFPIGTYYQQLNSRFDAYTAPCTPDSAPPDMNVKPFTVADLPWMTTAPDTQSAKPYTDTTNHVRTTVAGPDPAPGGTKGTDYGPLWIYAKPVKYVNPVPATGYVAYAATVANWKDLYNPGQPAVKSSYPSSVPYLGTGATYSTTPGHTGLRDRRVLNVPLLACPVAGNKASVKGVGRFFMTVPADGTHLYAEFAGLVDEQTLRTRVRLYP